MKARADRHPQKGVVRNRGFAGNRMEKHPKLVTAVSAVLTGCAGWILYSACEERRRDIWKPFLIPRLAGGGGKGPHKAVLLSQTDILSSVGKRRAGNLELLGRSLILSGALSNTLDRVRKGYVVDYIPIGKYFYNIGDFCIYIGTGAVLADFVKDLLHK
ncbi:MAG: signal peptidase II [Lachnospiraceae bacterium]|nr:signal peptidase II [Lachnospiraceae bacterium]